MSAKPPARVHVIGGGLAGLAAAVRLAAAGTAVVLSEAAQQAGGRCRSYFDATLQCRIDNGNHLLLSGNRAAMAYLDAIGARDTLAGPGAPEFPFLDVASGARWTVRGGAWPRIPGATVGDYARALRLVCAGREATVAETLGTDGELYRRFWRPLTVAALNTQPEEGAAALLRRVVRESFLRGAKACRPLLPVAGLSDTLVEPALATLARAGAVVRFTRRLRGLDFAAGRVAALEFEAGRESLAHDEAVVLAVPAPVAVRLVSEIGAPLSFRAIVNAHYRVHVGQAAPFFIGLVGGTAEWVFRKQEVLSVTVSAAERLVDEPADSLAVRLWQDVARAYDLPAKPMPQVQIVKERRATFAATPAENARRPGARTRWTNLALAGDWTATGLPATIEGAVQSGFSAAALLLGHSPLPRLMR